MKHSDINWAHAITEALKLVGKKYNFGQEVVLSERDTDKIESIDCSELTEWFYYGLTLIAGGAAGLVAPDGSYNQAKLFKKIDGTFALVGDLAFKWDPETHAVHHVGVYIGEGRILEAKGKQWGVVVTPVPEFVKSTHFAFWGRHPKIQDA